MAVEVINKRRRQTDHMDKNVRRNPLGAAYKSSSEGDSNGKINGESEATATEQRSSSSIVGSIIMSRHLEANTAEKQYS